MVHLGKLKLPFTEFLVAMVTGKMCVVGKLVLSAYLHSWHSANIWNVFLKIFVKIFFPMESMENLTFRQFLYYFSLFG